MRFLLALWGCALFAAADPALTEIRTVYFMPMGSNLDQYMANRLAAVGLFQVVTDPALADAVFTDKVGPAFEQAFTTLYPPPPPPEPEEKPEEKKEDAKKSDEKDKPVDTSIGAALAERPDVAPRISSFSKGRGNVFLIDRKTRRVLWSNYRLPENSRPDEMNKIAGKFIKQLGDDLVALRTPVK